MDSTQLSPNKIVHFATYSDAVNYFRTVLEFLNIFLLLTLWIGDAALILGELELNEISTTASLTSNLVMRFWKSTRTLPPATVHLFI